MAGEFDGLVVGECDVLAGPEVSKTIVQDAIRESLEKVGLSGFESRIARKLSGGESRRVALARALACKPEVLLLDEPVANVDRASAALFESLVVSLAAAGMTVVISSHDDRLGPRLGATMIYLEDGKLAGAPGQLPPPELPHHAEEYHAHS